MLSPATLTNAKYGQTVTPVTYAKNNLKLPVRKLWEKENNQPELRGSSWTKYRNSDHEKWDQIQSPQFVDFSNLPEIGDSFFNKITVIVSTPKPNFENEKLPNTVSENDTLVASLNNFSLSEIKSETFTERCENVNDENEKGKEQYVVHDSCIKTEEKIESETCSKVKKSQSTVLNPFNLKMKEKHRQQQTQKHVNRIIEQKKMKTFRANPVPRYLKTRPPTTTHDCNNHNNTTNEKTDSNANGKVQEKYFYEKHVKKNNEVWKKPPFIPCLSRKNVGRPKTPPLQTAARARERKRFDEALKMKEKQREEMRLMEIAAKKKQEEEEIARLRKQTVHKAQPIRKYKLGLPDVEKRPLTDPVSPISFKRRRRV